MARLSKTAPTLYEHMSTALVKYYAKNPNCSLQDIEKTLWEMWEAISEAHILHYPQDYITTKTKK